MNSSWLFIPQFLLLSLSAGVALCVVVMVDSAGSACTLRVKEWSGSDLEAFKARIAEVQLAEAKQAFKSEMLEACKPEYGAPHNTVSCL